MSEDYIRIHKPNSVASTSTLETPKKPKRKSVSQSAKKKQNKAQNNVTLNINNTEDILQHVFLTFEQKINQIKEQIHHDLFESIYLNTVEYFNFYALKREACNLDKLSSDLVFNPICNVIPTIALHTGINTQDYSYLCDNLSERLRENFTPYLFFINEKNSNNIKSLVSSIFVQWENTVEDRENLIKRNLFTFRYLFDTINKSNKDNEKPISVIFFFKQFELIPKETIESFVSLISCHVLNVSIYFIIELASQSNILYEQLTSNVISKLCIKKLYLMSPEHYIDRFLNKLFIEQSIFFKLSGDILKFLMDNYYEYNFSISSFIHALKFCFYDHLRSQNLNAVFLSSQLDEMDFYETILNELVINNPDNNEFLKTVCYDLGESRFNICIQRLQQESKQYHNQFVLVCQFLFEIVKHFPAEDDESSLFSSNTKSFTDLYVRLCNFSSAKTKAKKFADCEQYLSLKRLLMLSSANTINEICSSFMKLISTKALENQANYQTDFLNDLHEFAEILDKLKRSMTVQNLDRSFNEEEEDVLSSQNDISSYKLNRTIDSAAELTMKKKSNLSRRSTNRATLKTISENSPTKKPQLSQLAKKGVDNKQQTINLKNSMIDWLTNQFSSYFDTDYSTQLPFCHFFCYKDLAQVKKRICDAQRVNIHDCLIEPVKYLNLSEYASSRNNESPRKRLKNLNKESSPTSGGLGSSNKLLPISVLYKLYLECGHMINLYDWLMAFVDRMENADLKDLDPRKQKVLLALFFRSITELQFMGFIKPTNRKVDHVIKLTNGSMLLALE